MNQVELQKITKQFFNLMTAFAEQDAQSGYFGTDTLLHHSEIHLLAFLKQHPKLHQAQAAKMLGLTRGAVSQTVNRLEKKGFLVKRKDPNNRRRMFIYLTEKGHTACRNHEAAHRHYEDLIFSFLKDADDAQLTFLREFLANLEKSIF
ncbi:MAG: MarR family transcriptional regulator [Oscillospiraceae bacterium]|jgi:DNA-binding MarR family transcriptional regulator